MKTITLNKVKQIINDCERQAALAFHKNIDTEKRIHTELSGKYENLFEMRGEFMYVAKNGNETFFKNKYAKDIK